MPSTREQTAERAEPLSNEAFKRAVGVAAHRAIAELAASKRTQGAPATDHWQLAARLIPAQSLGPRTRVGRLMVASSVAVYRHYFLPDPSWELLGSEIVIEPDGRVDLSWQHRGGCVLYDELKLGAAFGRPDATSRARRQAARYSRQGVDEYGDRFAGVRLLLLGAPRNSVLVGPGPQLLPLTRSAYWFEHSSEVR